MAELTQQSQESGRPQVVSSFYPFYDITRQVAGDRAEVTSLVPPGQEPHSFDPSPQDIVHVSNADLYVAVGAEFGEWEDQVLRGHDVSVVQASDGVTVLPAEHGETDGHADGRDRGQVDPHYWLSPENAITITRNVEAALKEADPVNADYYERQADMYVAELKQLDRDYRERLRDCEHDRILTAHAAFAYLGDAYGFEQVPLLGLSPVSEPTPDQMQRLITAAEEHGIDYVFYEELVDPRVSETIAREAGAETLVLHPVTGAADPGETYISVMRQNLEQLETALECR